MKITEIDLTDENTIPTCFDCIEDAVYSITFAHTTVYLCEKHLRHLKAELTRLDLKELRQVRQKIKQKTEESKRNDK